MPSELLLLCLCEPNQRSWSKPFPAQQLRLLCVAVRALTFAVDALAAYDGPQSYDLNNPDSTTTKVQVLQVTSGHSKTEEDEDSDDEDDDIDTIPTGQAPGQSHRKFL